MVARQPPRTTYLVGRLDRIVRRGVEAVVAEHGLTVPQYTALSVLAVRPGLSNAQLARRSLMTPQGMNQAFAALSHLGLVRRVPHPDNKRILGLQLTEEGKVVVRRCNRAVESYERQLLSRLSSQQRRSLNETLALLADLGPDHPHHRANVRAEGQSVKRDVK
jgi:DNA-binding MarR family transcriptional regulator